MTHHKTPSLHAVLIDDLAAAIPGLQRIRFIRAVDRILCLSTPTPEGMAKIGDEIGESVDAQFFREMREQDRWKNGMIPDAFVVDESARVIRAFEVEVSHHIPAHKMDNYRGLWFALDGAGWELELIRVDRHGVQRQADLCGLWISHVRSRAPAPMIPLSPER